MPSKTAFVAIEDVPYGADIFYQYIVAPELEELVSEGSVVKCPFGKGSRTVRGIVVSVGQTDKTGRLKTIRELFQLNVFLSKRELELAEYIKKRCFCTFFDAARVIMPPGILSGFDRVYSVTDEYDGQLREYFEARSNAVEQSVLKHDFGSKTYAEVLNLVRQGLVAETFRPKKTVSDKTGRYAVLTEKAEKYVLTLDKKTSAAAKKHIDVLSVIGSGISKLSDIEKAAGCSSSVIKTLEKKGIIAVETRAEYRDPLKRAGLKKTVCEAHLNDEQKIAFDEISANMTSGGAHLLYGVTGSGKTHVFMALIDRVLAQGKTAIVLLPEISLTFQIVSRFYERYGDILALLHSGLSTGERFDEYKRIKSGEARVIVGTRSAVFAPAADIGLIVIDEEQEHTYKSEMNPKYNARDIAAYLVRRDKSLLLLSSATPSFESFVRAQSGIIGFSVLKQRFNRMPLPQVIVSDMTRERLSANTSMIGSELATEIAKNIYNKEQSILFVNRRGYNSYVSCPKCGYVYKCESCGIPLTFHKSDGKLICHYCGHSEAAPKTCGKCGSGVIKYTGYGTQRAEAELKKLFPELRIARMDSDTVGKKDDRDTVLTDFKAGRYDMLVGTQMITKGLDFPNVTLVGVLSADSLLYSSDFRAYENTFSLLTQVCGRAGRAEKPGRAVIQTYSPFHPVLMHAFEQDYEGFFKEESSLRKTLVYPPYCDICQTVFIADTLSRAFDSAEAFIGLIKKEVSTKEYADVPISIIRPRETAVPMVGGRHRVRILIKCRDNIITRKLLSSVYCAFLHDSSFRDVTAGIDINPLVII